MIYFLGMLKSVEMTVQVDWLAKQRRMWLASRKI